MYKRAYGIIETLAPLHVGASAGEETGNLNLIFRDQFTQTGIVPGSSIRGRFRADMRENKPGQEHDWYGKAVQKDDSDTTEALVKFEYASLLWLPVFCPGQPVVWVSCPWLLKRYKQMKGLTGPLPQPYSAPKGLPGRQVQSRGKILFFNLGFLEIKHEVDLSTWVPEGTELREKHSDRLVVVDNNDMAMIHDMALYRQSRVKLSDTQKKVDGGAFFNVEALPEGSVLIFPIALKKLDWRPFGEKATDTPYSQELYFGGLESIGFGRCQVTLQGEY